MTSITATTPIVVTPNALTSSMIGTLTADQANLATVEQQVSTGNQLNVASDNPAAAADVLQLQGSLTRANQYSANAQDGIGWLSLGNSTVNSVLSVIQSVKSTVEGVSGSTLTNDPATISSIAQQVQSALQQLTNLANTQYENGQPLFAGTGNSTAAYDANGNYLGNAVPPTRTVAPGTQVAVAVTGPQVFGSGTTGLLGTGQGGSPVGVLQQIVNDLKTGTSASISNVEGTDLTNLSNALGTAETAAGVLGANEQSVQGFSTQATSTVASLQQELGNVQDTNMAQAITSLQLQQVAYQSALYATSQLSSDSLVKYL